MKRYFHRTFFTTFRCVSVNMTDTAPSFHGDMRRRVAFGTEIGQSTSDLCQGNSDYPKWDSQPFVPRCLSV